jgi:regulator of replication initiation timing
MTNSEMIQKLETDGLSSVSDMDFITNALEENTKLKAEIEQLKATISKMETTTAQEDDLK